MTFGEKIKELRTEKGLSQTQLGNAIGVSMRTIRGWETEGRYPKQHDIYMKLAQTLQCEVSYLMGDQEVFLTDVAQQYGSRGSQQAQAILEQTAAMFAGGELSEEDQIAFLTEIQALYLDSKQRAKKFTPKKYHHNDTDE